MTNINWNKFPNFSESEFTCKCGCNQTKMNYQFMHKLQELRTRYNKPMQINSGYRCPKHPVEAKKQEPGAHSSGMAADIACNGPQAYEILRLAFDMGFTGIGVAQKGNLRFVHLDTIQQGFVRPNVWSY